MSFIQSVKRGVMGIAAVGNANGNQYNQSVMQYLNDKSVIWMPDKPLDYINYGYYLNPDVYAAVQTIVNLATIAPLNLYQIKPDKEAKKAYQRYKSLCAGLPDAENLKQRAYFKTKALEEVDSHKILDRLNKPNEWQTLTEFRSNFYGFRLVTGNAYVFKSRAQLGTSEVMKLYILPTQEISIQSGGPTDPVKKYLYGINRVEYDPEDIIHNRSWSLDYSYPGSHLFGISPLKAARRSITMSNDGREAQTAMLKNMGSKGLLAFDALASGMKGPLTEEQLQLIKDKYNVENAGIKNAGRVNVTNGKFEWHQMGMSSVDLSIIESQKWSKTDICQVYGISPILLASMDAATYSNYKEAKKAAITMAVIPLLRSEADSYNMGLVPEFTKDGNAYILDHDLTIYTELQEDRKEQADYLSRSWWLTPNEARIEMGYGEMPNDNMNKVYAPSSVMELDELNKPTDIANLPLNSGDY